MNVCPDCFEARGLQLRIEEIRPGHDVGRCNFHPTKKGVPLVAVAEIVDRVFRDNYVGGIEDPYSMEPPGDTLLDAVQDLTDAGDSHVAEVLCGALVDGDSYWPPDGEEAFYSDEYRYRQDPFRYALGEPARLWRDFQRSLLHSQRFFNTDARDLVSKIFQDVHQQRDNAKSGPVYLIRPSEPQSRFFRARVANTEAQREEIAKDLARNLGPPPERARRAGRLNPAGVAGFYAAFDLATCVAELRPSVGSVVVAAEFEITAPICVLDTTRFAAQPRPVDLFARHAQDRAAQWAFMQTFMGEIAQPISPDDEHLDYLPTQAVAEYLNCHHHFKFAGQHRTIDAIIYGSAQHAGGKNIVILGEAAVVGNTPGDVSKIRPDPHERWANVGRRLTPSVPARIVPLPNTLVKHRVSGATYDTAVHYDVNDVGVEDEDD